MTILIDLSQIAISNLMNSPDVQKSKYVDSLLVKHMVLNSIKGYKKKFGSKYGDIVIACDSVNEYWRKDIFPYYKEHRKKDREKSKLDWNEIFNCISEIKRELKEYFPYRVIEVDRAEGDDVIAVIAMNETEPTVIIGSDKDYAQLHKYSNIKQYSPTKKKFVEIEDAEAALNALIITGDKDDGIPNIKSDSDTFVNDAKRQSPIKKVDIPKWSRMQPKEFCESSKMLDNHKRNKELISFEYIPKDIVDEVLIEYNKEPIGSKKKIMQYFQENRMRNLLSDIDEF